MPPRGSARLKASLGNRQERFGARRLRSAITTLLRCVTSTERADLTACCGLAPTQAATLEILEREGPLRLGVLAQRLAVDPSTLTRRIQRIEGHALLRRDRDCEDSRALRVSLTANGRRLARRLESREEEFALHVLRLVRPDRREPLLAAVGDLVRALQGAAESCCAAGVDEERIRPPWSRPSRAG